MAADGAWRPAIDFLADALQQQTSVRAYIRGESLLQGFLAAYLGASGYFVFHTEKELEKGYADMVLEPLTARYPSIRHGYVIELKYLTRSPREGSPSRRRVGERQGATTHLPGRRTTSARTPDGALHRPGAGVSRLGTGAMRGGTGGVVDRLRGTEVRIDLVGSGEPGTRPERRAPVVVPI